MNWATFQQSINATSISRQHSPGGTIRNVLGPDVDLGFTQQKRNIWYPGGYTGPDVVNGTSFRGYRYVDMDNSYFGRDPAFLSEANFCALLILLDHQTGSQFLTHISAATDITNLQGDLRNFLAAINHDVGRPNMYVFRGASGTNEEPDLMMQLLSNELTDEQLRWLALSARFIEGEGGLSWRAYSSVYVRYKNAVHKLKVAF